MVSTPTTAATSLGRIGCMVLPVIPPDWGHDDRRFQRATGPSFSSVTSMSQIGEFQGRLQSEGLMTSNSATEKAETRVSRRPGIAKFRSSMLHKPQLLAAGSVQLRPKHRMR